jgi:hypothetical protein
MNDDKMKPKRHRWQLGDSSRGIIQVIDRCLDCNLVRIYDKLEQERCYFRGDERFERAGPCVPRAASPSPP